MDWLEKNENDIYLTIGSSIGIGTGFLIALLATHIKVLGFIGFGFIIGPVVLPLLLLPVGFFGYKCYKGFKKVKKWFSRNKTYDNIELEQL